MSRILIVDDDENIRQTIRETLSKEGHDMVECRNGQQAIDWLSRASADLVILDVVMPEKDGYEVCNWMLQQGISAPILMLSSKDSDMDKAIGLNLGADDYFSKPFSTIELIARVKARLRKKSNEKGSEQIKLGNMVLDPDQRRFWIDGQEILLSATEYELMALFMEQPGRVFTRDLLIDHLRGHDYPCQPHAIDNHMYRLRLKLKKIATCQVVIDTVRNTGFRLVSQHG